MQSMPGFSVDQNTIILSQLCDFHQSIYIKVAPSEKCSNLLCVTNEDSLSLHMRNSGGPSALPYPLRETETAKSLHVKVAVYGEKGN